MPASRAELAFALGRPFEEQVAFFRGKLGNLVPTAKWDDIKKSAHDSAFMVAGAAKADLLADLAAAVDKAIADGETLQQFRKRFGEIVRRHGWSGWTGDDRKNPADPKDTGGAGYAWRTRVIYRTNMATSYAAGRLAQLKSFPVWVYRHGGSLDPRPQHLSWNGLTLPADHPFWKTHYPPSAFNCSCYVTGALSRDMARHVGGNPDFDTPPAGWDAIDPQTGEPPGIGKGWGYQPGASVLCKDSHASGGGRRCADMRLVDTLLQKLRGQPALLGAQMVDAWPPHVFELLAVRFGKIAEDLIARRHPQGMFHFVGAMRAAWVQAGASYGASIKTAELTVRDQDITHAMRPSKVRDGKAVDPLWYRNLPLHLRQPQAVLLAIRKTGDGAVKQEMQLIYDSGEDKAKIVVLVDYLGSGPNIVRTAGRLIETDTLRAEVDRGEKFLIDGGL